MNDVQVATKNHQRLFNLVDRGGNTYVQMFDNQLRRFIWESIDEQVLIEGGHLYKTEDDSIKRTQCDRSAVFLLEETIQQWTYWFSDYKNRINEPTFDLRGDIGDDFHDIHDSIVDLGRFLLDTQTRLIQENSDALNGGKISFARAFFALQQDNLLLCVRHEDSKYAGQVREVRVEPASLFAPKHLVVELIIYVNSGKGIKQSRWSFNIYEFDGEENVANLGIITLTDKIKAQLIERGRRYVNLTSTPSYVTYDGSIARRGWWSTNYFRATGRVMVDLMAMKTIDPDYRRYFAINADRDTDEEVKETSVTLTDEVLMCTSPYVYGFSFSAKQWGEMKVDSLTNIVFRDDAFDQLVLPVDIKEMLYALVDNEGLIGRDFIDGKGGGCIFLLAGSPGVGKSLTAEAIAEKLQQPLYMIGVGELGTSVEALERNLRNILDIATAWKAVLLLDEADIFMEERDDINIERNAMVGVFLRMLEYYQGTLFLTTNRAKSIDSAFYSRISLAIKYEDLNDDSRAQIWNNILKMYGLNEFVDISRLSDFDINGRQIKNVVRIVTALAAKNGSNRPTTNDFIKVINHIMKFKMDI